MPDVSAEVRWFLEGAPPRAAEAWLRALAPGPLLTAERRTDRYLPPLGPDEPGVKARGGSEGGAVEPKQRTAVLGPVRFGARVAGQAEAWRKWRVEAKGAAPRDWLAVAKTRRMRTFALHADGVQPADGARPRQGANVELTRLRLGGAPWWSVCVEAYGPDTAAAEAALRAVARHVFSRPDAPALPAAASMGYPAWLFRTSEAG